MIAENFERMKEARYIVIRPVEIIVDIVTVSVIGTYSSVIMGCNDGRRTSGWNTVIMAIVPSSDILRHS